MVTRFSRRAFLGSVSALGVGAATGGRAEMNHESNEDGARLLHRIDCTQDFPADRYFASGNVTVVTGPAGTYREAEASPLSRFGYRFPIDNIGRPHVAVIRYPDDKRRFMCIMDGTCYDLTTGVFTGWEQPLSNEMLTMRQVFWPRWEDCSLTFLTWGEGEPAAAAEIEIWELEDLPPLQVPGDSGPGSRREIGIQYEDPCGNRASEGARTKAEWIDHIVSYALHTGQQLLTYPMAWYHGPQFPSQCEPAGALGMAVAEDRKQYVFWTEKPVDWYADLLTRFGNEGLEFQGALTLMRLGTLMENMNVDQAAIEAGAETYNNVGWNNRVQSSTHDWTLLYNVRNFKQIADKGEKCEPFSGVSSFAYGEHRNPGCHTGPMFNPLHPTVQEAIIRFAGEIGDRYAKFPAFKGISFNMFASAMPWFGSIHLGYDDYSVQLFETETGIHVPVDAKSPNRFAERYDFIVFVCREAWVAWRCRKIHDLFSRIRQRLAAARSDLRVTITLWDETVVNNVLGYRTGHLMAAHQQDARRTMAELYRDAGIDLALYGNEPGLEIDLAIGNSRDRGGHGTRPMGGVNLTPEEACMYRDSDYLDIETLDAMADHDRPGAFIFNCWVEAWGKHEWFPTEPNDPNLPEMSVECGQPVDGVLRANSEYPKDGFWWDSQLRITPGFPAEPHFLEPYAHALAQFDACRITRGGLFLDKAHGESIRRFAQAYRALPDRRFDTVGETTDPVAVRTLVHEGRRYVYAVNRDYYPVDVTFAFGGDATNGVMDLATSERLTGAQAQRFTLAPYGLRVFAMDPGLSVAGFTATPPAPVVEGLRADAATALDAIEAVRAKGLFVPGMDEMGADIQAAVANGRWAWLRRALTGYIVRTCRQRATA